MKQGLVVFSFALRDEEPNPCNVRLADAVRRILRIEANTIVIAQWEVALRLREYGVTVDHVVNPGDDGAYLGSQEVWNEAREFLLSNGIHKVILVAQPFLQLSLIRRTVRRDGFTIIPRRIPKIGFDASPLNTQPWTRSRRALLWYATKLILGGNHGHAGRQSA